MLSPVCNPEESRIHAINREKDDSGTQHPGFERHTNLNIGTSCSGSSLSAFAEPSSPDGPTFDSQTDTGIERVMSEEWFGTENPDAV